MYNTQQQHNANAVPIRESSMIVEDYSGSVRDIRILRTYSDRPMITFNIGSTAFKALNDLATAIQKAEGRQIEVSARKGSFRGMTEYAVTALKAIDGTIVDLRDNFKPEPIAPAPATKNRLIDSIQQQMHEAVTLTESEWKQIAEAIAEPRPEPEPVAEAEKQPEPEPRAAPATETIVAPELEPEATTQQVKKPYVPDFEPLIEMWMRTFAKYSDAEVTKKAESSSKWACEAARRVLAERLNARTIREAMKETSATTEAEPGTETTEAPEPEFKR